MFNFTLADTFSNSGSDIDIVPLLQGEEMVLVNGFSGAVCDRVPPFAEEDNAPIIGILPNGEWVQWTPQIQLEDNGPSINDVDMTANVLSDGGGALAIEAGSNLKCSNVQRSLINEETCFLSTESTACSTDAQSPSMIEGGTIVCGSRSEVSNNPALSEHFDVHSEVRAVTDLSKHLIL